MGIVVFDPFAFKVRYPAFNAVSNPALQGCFDDATLYLSNKDTSPVQCLARRAQLLNMLTAHIATLGGLLSPGGSAQPVGRVSQASEGSVSASLDYVPATPGSGAWFNQTQYGATFWQATSSLRGMRYLPFFPRIYPNVYR